MIKKIIAFVFIWMGILLGNAQKKWTLKECVVYALENNLSVQKTQLDTQLSSLGKQNAIGAFLPSLNSNANHNWNTGTNIDVTTNTYVTRTVQNTSLGLQAGITLFDGLRNLNNLYKANLSVLAARYQLDNMKDNIALQVANAFLQILFNRENLKVSQAQYDLSKMEKERLEQLVKNNVKPAGDLLQITATLATQEQKIVEGENKVQISKIALANILQLKDALRFDIVDDTYDIPLSQIIEKSPQEIFEKSLTIRNDIRAAEVNVEIAALDISLAKGNFLPTLTGSFNYGTRASQESSFADLMNQFELNDGFSFGLSLRIPIFNKFQNFSAFKRSQILFEKSQLDLEQKKLQLKDRVYQAYADTKGAFKTYVAADKTMQARKQAMDYVKQKYEAGLMNSFEFNQSRVNVQAAENELIKAKYDYIFKLKILEIYFGIPVAL